MKRTTVPGKVKLKRTTKPKRPKLVRTTKPKRRLLRTTFSKNASGIYQIRSKINGKIYVGSSKHLHIRIEREHKGELKRNAHGNKHLQRHCNKYGIDDLVFEILEFCPEEHLTNGDKREQYWMDLLQPKFNNRPSAESNRGYKHTAAAKEKCKTMLGKKHTEAAKEKMRQAALGRVFTKEHLANMAIAREHRYTSPEAKERMRQASLGRIPWNKGKKGVQIPWNKGIKGYHLPEETGLKMSIARMGHPVSEETKRKISLGRKGKLHTDEYKRRMKEVHKNITEETRQKMRDSHLGQTAWNKGKTYKQKKNIS